MAYVGKGTFNDAMISGSDKSIISGLQKAWSSVMGDNDKSNDYLAKDYHDAAELIRSSYGYSGGGDGSENIPIAQKIISPVYVPTGSDQGSGSGSVNVVTDQAGTTTVVKNTETPVSDEFFGNVPTGVSQVTGALTNIDTDKLIAVGAGFMFLMFFGNFLTRRRR